MFRMIKITMEGVVTGLGEEPRNTRKTRKWSKDRADRLRAESDRYGHRQQVEYERIVV